MKNLIILLSIFITGCQTLPPQALSWDDSLKDIQEEPINKNIEKISQEIESKKDVWSN